jgi:hypothetical protein
MIKNTIEVKATIKADPFQTNAVNNVEKFLEELMEGINDYLLDAIDWEGEEPLTLRISKITIRRM